MINKSDASSSAKLNDGLKAVIFIGRLAAAEYGFRMPHWRARQAAKVALFPLLCYHSPTSI
jgi:hypothetical protein